MFNLVFSDQLRAWVTVDPAPMTPSSPASICCSSRARMRKLGLLAMAPIAERQGLGAQRWQPMGRRADTKPLQGSAPGGLIGEEGHHCRGQAMAQAGGGGAGAAVGSAAIMLPKPA